MAPRQNSSSSSASSSAPTTNSTIQGLNLVSQPAPPASAYEALHLPQGFPELAQLELWSHLAFQSDDPLPPTSLTSPSSNGTSPKDDAKDDEECEDERARDGRTAAVESHENVAAPAPASTVPASSSATLPPPPPPHFPTKAGDFDLAALLASFSADPFSVPGSHQQLPHQPQQQQQSLAQLLAFAPPPPPPTTSAPASLIGNGGSNGNAAGNNNSGQGSVSAPASKRPRTRKASTATVPPSTPSITTSSTNISNDNDGDEDGTQDADIDPHSTFSAAEDKRRRNTAASARFRLKKKEREAALEKRAKELEARVGELERECEGLRRENGWLKGLVVGVTGVGVNVGVGVGVPASGQVQVGGKRAREE